MAQGIVTSFEAMEAMMPFLKSDGQDGVLDAAVAVARAYLSLVPADSDEVIDADFLVSVGFRAVPSDMGPTYSDHFEIIKPGVSKLNIWNAGYSSGEWLINGFDSWPLYTRGDLRRLMAALGIPTERPQ